ncbi:hypothetical protein OV203_02120 [Nannocystis sp. ILAH1]|uniref:hypothetical protein n=1 Tax=unclassified Nannocystis TaxID=2627009 RepID=UPI00227076D2|nr:MULTISPECIES: hypothetical protein [unclassified Nannocystis]MCY0985907.1 hypothetical protein [Nannocystis sp. ILAH1]MCY1068546.1 hypothetical protein [Nannocystis sp. RBIL2]
MMYKSTTKRLLATSVVAVLLPGVVGSVYLVPDVAHAEVKTVACKVTAFLVQKDGDGIIPADLKFLEEQLQDDSFAAFKGFRLLETKALRLGVDKPGLAALKSGFQLKLSLLGEVNSKLKLHANLLAPGRDAPLVDTDYAIDDNGLLLVGGVRHLEGKIFFAIQCGKQPS